MPAFRRVSVVLAAAISIVAADAARASERLPNGVLVDRNLVYSKAEVFDGREKRDLLLDLYRPEEVDGKLPVIVWVHGGAWWAGSKTFCPAVWMVRRGYAVASINYRLSQHAPFPAQIHDCKASIRYLRSIADKFALDSDRIGVWGASAGGHLVSLLGTSADVSKTEAEGGHSDHSSRVQCVLNWFGPTDLIRLNGPDGADIGGRNPITALLGGEVDQKRDLAILADPITHVTKDDPPFLIMHGTADKLVPLEQSELLEAALKKAKVEVELHVVQGAGHGFWSADIKSRIERFFDRHLRSIKAVE